MAPEIGSGSQARIGAVCAVQSPRARERRGARGHRVGSSCEVALFSRRPALGRVLLSPLGSARVLALRRARQPRGRGDEIQLAPRLDEVAAQERTPSRRLSGDRRDPSCVSAATVLAAGREHVRVAGRDAGEAGAARRQNEKQRRGRTPGPWVLMRFELLVADAPRSAPVTVPLAAGERAPAGQGFDSSSMPSYKGCEPMTLRSRTSPSQ